MMHTCPKCGDYYADDLLAFCFVDGTPLVDVAPHGETWSEGVRVLEEKECALRKQKRRLKWRRVLLSAMTMMLVIMVVCVVAANSLIYLQPGQEEVVEDKPLTPATARLDAITRSTGGKPVPASWPRPTATRKPAVPPRAAQPTTPARDPEPPALASPTPTPRLPTLSTTPVPASECSNADKSRARETIINEFGNMWRRNIEGDRRKIVAENAPRGVENAEASLGAIEYESTFFRTCTAGFVTVRYVWQIRANVNGTIKVVAVAQKKRFACVKAGATWLCS